MMQTNLYHYGAVRLHDMEGDMPLVIPQSDATHLRLSVPADAKAQQQLTQQGFAFADRTLDVSVNLMRSKQEFATLVRSTPTLTDEFRADVEQLALASFPTDSRFHFGGECDGENATAALHTWVRELGSYYLCLHKGEAAGFLALRKAAPDCRFVHLAAVGERYRAAGIALSLYAHAAAVCKAEGVRLLEGRISSSNTPVMNLYAFLGATFSNPRDVYVKEV